MKGINWRTLTFKKRVIYLIKVIHVVQKHMDIAFNTNLTVQAVCTMYLCMYVSCTGRVDTVCRPLYSIQSTYKESILAH